MILGLESVMVFGRTSLIVSEKEALVCFLAFIWLTQYFTQLNKNTSFIAKESSHVRYCHVEVLVTSGPCLFALNLFFATAWTSLPNTC